VGRVFSPLDEELGLLPGRLSPRLVEGMTRLATWMPFVQAAEYLAFFWGVPLSASTVRQHTEAAGAAYVAVQTTAVAALEREPPPPPPGPAVQQVSADGAMVPLVGGEWAEVKTLVIGTVLPPDPTATASHPRATDLSYFARLADAETFTRLATVETHPRGVATAGTVVGVMDGAAWLQGFLDYHRPDAVRVLDFPHAVEHLTVAAQATFGVGTAAAQTWLTEQAHVLKHGDPGQVLAALHALPTATAADPMAAAQAQAETLAYLTSRWDQIQYAAFQACGSPIGSGAVERATKLVGEARLKGRGMHWARQPVDPLLALRPIACTDRWADAWPQIVQPWRRQAAAQRQRRPRARCPAAPMPAPLVVPTAPTPRQRSTAIPRLPPQRSGRPHPWRRPFSTAERIRQATAARL
jgi:hypothetical protein